MRAARAKFGADIGVATALGVELERHGEIDEAVAILRPLLERHSDNVQAALALAKIEIDTGSIGKARQLALQAHAAAPSAFRPLAICIQSDVDVAEGHPEIALARLEKVSEPEPLVVIAKLEALSPAYS